VVLGHGRITKPTAQRGSRGLLVPRPRTLVRSGRPPTHSPAAAARATAPCAKPAAHGSVRVANYRCVEGAEHSRLLTWTETKQHRHGRPCFFHDDAVALVVNRDGASAALALAGVHFGRHWIPKALGGFSTALMASDYLRICLQLVAMEADGDGKE
jgi:hypothetical protein